MRSLSFQKTRPSYREMVGAVLFLCTCTSLHASEFIPLGFLPGDQSSKAQGVSADGSIVAGVAAPSPYESHAVFRWTGQTGVVGLGVPEGGSATMANGNGISGDGSAIVAKISSEAAVYTEADGWHKLGFLPGGGAGFFGSVARAASFDGTVVVGDSDSDEGVRAFRWTEAGGMVSLGTLHDRSYARDVSADGSVVVGHNRCDFGECPFQYEPFVWSADSGMVGLGFEGQVRSVSADGTVVGGEVDTDSDGEAFRWTEETGVVRLGWLPDTVQSDGSNRSVVTGINSDGSVIVGFSGSGSYSDINNPENPTRAFIWTEAAGMRDLQQLLVEQYGLGRALGGWNLWAPEDISANGQFIAGIGVNPRGAVEGWLVRLDAPIPEPPSGVLAVLAGLLALPARRRLRRPDDAVHRGTGPQGDGRLLPITS